MAKIVRGPRAADHYTIISNAALRDERLTWKARGLLAYLLSMDTGWETSIRRLATVAPDGKSAVETALAELETFGYLERRQTRAVGDSAGTFSGTEYHVGDESTVTRSSGHGQTESTVTRFSGAGSSGPGQSATKKTSPKKNSPPEDSSSSDALRASTAPPVETSSSNVTSRNATLPAAAANEPEGDHGDAPRAVTSPASILDSMMLNPDESTRFRDWLVTATGATNPDGLIVTLYASGRLSERLGQWRTSENSTPAPVAPAAPRPGRLAWCGECDPDSRTIMFNRDPHTGRELVRRCPACHVLAGSETPGSGAVQAIAFEAAVAAANEANGRGRAAFEAARAALPQGVGRRTTTIGDVIDPTTTRRQAESETTR